MKLAMTLALILMLLIGWVLWVIQPETPAARELRNAKADAHAAVFRAEVAQPANKKPTRDFFEVTYAETVMEFPHGMATEKMECAVRTWLLKERMKFVPADSDRALALKGALAMNGRC